ncbi:uncharacterized protein LOC128393945 [Panonychus citri]|uniref:uncharacterized protein LOC128393945 n=1 Tax=Panonychus citri TaxID=50023 RepID=UPI00230720D3|nr:uncharacterized protein LOC128393945 [Panonychus citri]
MNQILRSKFFYRIRYFIGLPDDHEYDQYVVNIIGKLEILIRDLLFTRRGYDQNRTNYELEGFYWKNIIIRIVIVVSIVRAFLGAIWLKDESKQLLLGNPFHGQPLNLIILPQLCFAIGGLSIFREYILYLESSGFLKLVSIFRTIQQKGFDRRILNLTDNQCKIFRKSFTLIVTNVPRVIKFLLLVLVLQLSSLDSLIRSFFTINCILA